MFVPRTHLQGFGEEILQAAKEGPVPLCANSLLYVPIPSFMCQSPPYKEYFGHTVLCYAPKAAEGGCGQAGKWRGE